MHPSPSSKWILCRSTLSIDLACAAGQTGFKSSGDSSVKLLIYLNNADKNLRENVGVFLTGKSICFIYYLECYFPFGVTHRMLHLHSHTLSLGSCCQSWTVTCLSHSLTNCISLNLIFFCVIHCGGLLTNQSRLVSRDQKYQIKVNTS